MQNIIGYKEDVIHVYIDESGDLGFKKKSSKTFVIAYIITTSPNNLKTKIGRLRKRLRSKRRKKRVNIREFKFSRDRDEVRRMLLHLLAESDIDVGYIVIDKRYVKDDLRKNPTILYNYLVINYIIHNIVIHYQPRKTHEEK